MEGAPFPLYSTDDLLIEGVPLTINSDARAKDSGSEAAPNVSGVRGRPKPSNGRYGGNTDLFLCSYVRILQHVVHERRGK